MNSSILLMGQTCHIFCDESRTSNEAFMVLGGIIAEDKDIAGFCHEIQTIKSTTGGKNEIKWSETSNHNLKRYMACVDCVFNNISKTTIHFHSVMFETAKIDHNKFSGGRSEDGFYKFFYQLLIHGFGRYYCRKGENDTFIVYMDNRTTKYNLSDLKDILNNGMKKKFSEGSRPFRSIQFVDSKNSEAIQMVDLIIGAIGFQKNGLHLDSSKRQAKKDLAHYIATKAGLKDLTTNTPKIRVDFTLWNFRLS